MRRSIMTALRPLARAVLAALIAASCISLATAQTDPDGKALDLSPGSGVIGGRPGMSIGRTPRGSHKRIINPLDSDLPASGDRSAVQSDNDFPLRVHRDDGEEGPPHGMSLEQAVGHLLRNNLDLRVAHSEIPQAAADAVTAGLRTNPQFYADVQQVPYGSFSTAACGGPTQYDINVALPVDVSHKRQARIRSASVVNRIALAQYYDVARRQTDNLYSVFIDTLASQVSVTRIMADVSAIDKHLATASSAEKAALQRKRLQLKQEQDDAQSSWDENRRALAVLLNMPATAVPQILLRGTLAEPAEQFRVLYVPGLQSVAAARRPDLQAQRLAVERAVADSGVVMANRLDDVFVLAQPYTFQNGSPYHLNNSWSWSLGVTVPMPIFNRQQGNIEKAHLIVEQARMQVAALERTVTREVEKAAAEYRDTNDEIDALEEKINRDHPHRENPERQRVPREAADANQPLDPRAARLQRDIEKLEEYMYQLQAREYLAVLQKYRDAILRHRKSMLRVNTAVGQRVFP